MEYLMTYGWALLVIVIVIGILLVLNPFQSPQGCRFDQLSFTCTNAIVQSTGVIYLQVTNGNSNAITVQNVSCVAGTAPAAPPFTTDYTSSSDGSGKFWGSSQLIQPQTSFMLTNDTAMNQTVTCKTSNTEHTDFTGIAGNTFSGKVYIYYKNNEDPDTYPARVAVASVTTKIQ